LLRPLQRRFAIVLLACFFFSAASASQSAGAFRDWDCSDFNTHKQAQRFFKKHHPNRDPYRLDGDNDGIACEDLP